MGLIASVTESLKHTLYNKLGPVGGCASYVGSCTLEPRIIFWGSLVNEERGLAPFCLYAVHGRVTQHLAIPLPTYHWGGYPHCLCMEGCGLTLTHCLVLQLLHKAWRGIHRACCNVENGQVSFSFILPLPSIIIHISSFYLVKQAKQLHYWSRVMASFDLNYARPLEVT